MKRGSHVSSDRKIRDSSTLEGVKLDVVGLFGYPNDGVDDILEEFTHMVLSGPSLRLGSQSKKAENFAHVTVEAMCNHFNSIPASKSL